LLPRQSFYFSPLHACKLIELFLGEIKSAHGLTNIIGFHFALNNKQRNLSKVHVVIAHFQVQLQLQKVSDFLAILLLFGVMKACLGSTSSN
jgi:hypothetical protein